MIEYVNLIERLSIEKQHQFLREADEQRLLKEHNLRTRRISHQMLERLGGRMEFWGSQLKHRFSAAPKESSIG